jgi:hypothetical protein
MKIVGIIVSIAALGYSLSANCDQGNPKPLILHCTGTTIGGSESIVSGLSVPADDYFKLDNDVFSRWGTKGQWWKPYTENVVITPGFIAWHSNPNGFYRLKIDRLSGAWEEVRKGRAPGDGHIFIVNMTEGKCAPSAAPEVSPAKF